MPFARKWVKQLGRKAICWPPLHSVFEWVLVLSLKADPSLAISLPQTGAKFSLGIDDQTILSQLDEIPSETSSAERRFLYNFFRKIWTGNKNVLEIGPFLVR